MSHPPSPPGEPTKRRAHLSPSCDNLRNIYFSVTSGPLCSGALGLRPEQTLRDDHDEESCPEGTRGAPEAKGECRDGACVLISEKTHVFDSANRPWLLPFIAEKATGAERDLLLTLIRHASKARDEDRPSFAQMVDHLDRFEHQKRGN